MKHWIRFFCLSLLSIVAGMASAQSAEDVIKISTVQKLKEFRDAVNSGTSYAGKTVELTADLDLQGEDWIPIGTKTMGSYPGTAFKGVFDGCNHTISNLKVNSSEPEFATAGLFGSIASGTIQTGTTTTTIPSSIKNLTLKNVDITSTHFAAGIVAYASNDAKGSSIENCKVIGGTIKSTPEIVDGSYDNGDKAGGIMGYNATDFTINNCIVEGVKITAYRDLGGIVGYSDGNVTNNTAKNVTVTQDLTNGYKDTRPTTIGDIVGRGSATNNVEANGNKVIKSAPVAQIGETKYETIADAVKAAKANDVIKIIKAGEYTLPGLPNNVTIEGAVDGVVFTHTSAGSVASVPNGATFKNVTFNFGNVDYHGFQHAGTINMEGCKLNGRLTSYGDMNFTNCTFEQTNPDYHMWVYGPSTVKYISCTFNGKGKFLNVYREGSEENNVIVDQCTFNSDTKNKAAINVKATSGTTLLKANVTITNCTTNENFPEASSSDALVVLNSLVQVDDRTADGVDKITVTQDGKKIYPVSYVAQIGNVKYESLAKAVAAVKDGETILMLADVPNAGGMSVSSGKNFTVDFDGHTYTLNKPGAGSTGTETNGFQLLKNSTIVFKNGTINISEEDLTKAVDPAKNIMRIIQNYANLTLENMTIDGTNQYGGKDYIMSFNNGTSVIKDTKVVGADKIAFDVCTWSGYVATGLEVTGSSEITGDIEISSSNTPESLSLTLTSGTHNGEIVMAQGADKATVTKKNDFVQAAPEGYKWVDNGDGTSTLKPCEYVAQIGEGENIVKYETLAEAVAAVKDGETILMLADVPNAGGMSVSSGKNFTVDFDGHTYTLNKPGAGSTGTETNGFQLLKNSTIVFKNGTINISEEDLTKAVDPAKNIMRIIQNYANLTLENMTIDGTNQYGGKDYIMSFNNGTSVIKDTKVVGADKIAFDVCTWSSYKATSLDVTGNSEIKGDIEISSTNTPDALSLMLTSGTHDGAIIMAQGADKATVSKDNEFVQAAPEGYKWVDNGNGTSTLKPCEYVAQIGDVKYETLESAWAEVKDGETITLLADCTGNGIKAPQGKFTTGVTIDFNNHTYTMDGSTVGSSGTKTQAFQLLKDNKITFKNGSIIANNADVKMMIQNYSDLTLDNMTLDATQGTNSINYVLSTNNGNTVIKDTKITAKEGGKAFDVDSGWGNYASNTVELTGESVITGDIEVAFEKKTEGTPSVLKLTSGTLNGKIVLGSNADECTITKSDNFVAAAPADHKWVDNGNGTSMLKPCEYVAHIGDVKYETLEAAFAAAEDGETITLLADCTGNGIKAPQGTFSQGLTVDFAGHTYTVDGATVGSTGTETNGFQLLKDNKITFKGGTITSEKAKILIQNYSDLTLEGMTLTLNNTNYTSAYTLSNNNGNIVIDGTTINANPAGGFAFDVCRYASYPSVNVTVKGESKINGDVEVFASNNDAKDGFKLMLEAGTMTGNIVLDASAKAAMAATPEKATVSKSNTLTAIAAPDGYKWVDNGNGTSTLAPAHYIAAIGDEKYETLQEAINACEAGAETTIKLLVDVEDGSAFEIADSKKNANLNIIIDFDNHSYNVTKNAVGSARTKSQAMHFASGNTLTLKNGTISSAATSEENNLKMMMQNYCDLTLDGMTIDCSNINGGTYPDYSGTTYEYWSLKSVPVFNFNTGNATIKNTTISFRDGDNVGLCVDGGTVALGEGVVVNGAVSAVSGSVTITDGKYSGAVTADQATLKISGGVYTKVPADEYCAEGYIVTDNTDDATKERYHFAVKTKEAAGIYELIHDVPYKYVDGVANAEKITYTRTFEERVVGKFQTWYVPFDYTISEKDLENFKFYKIHLISAANQIGGEVTDNTAIYVYVQEVGANTKLTGNRPYVIKAKNALTDFVFEVNNTKLYAKDNSSRLHVETTDFNYDFYGNYDDYSGEPAYTWYSLNKKGQLQPNSETATLRSYHWYIKATARGENADYAKPNFFIVEGDGETDGINNAQTTEAEIEGIYTLGGIKVEHLVKGVNIIKYTDGRTKKINVK